MAFGRSTTGEVKPTLASKYTQVATGDEKGAKPPIRQSYPRTMPNISVVFHEID